MTESAPDASSDVCWRRRRLAVIAFCLAGCLSYVFMVSAGTMTRFPRLVSFYEKQADGFLDGRLDIGITPAPELLAAEDPYAPELRSHHTWDTSYYQGKVYIYFGPTPALWTAAVKYVTGAVQVADLMPCLFFACMRLLFAAACLFQLWRRYWPGSPTWPLLVGLSVLAWGTPIPFVLGRPATYEASILGAQACLAAGLYFAIAAATTDRRGLALLHAALCSTSLGLALASRLSVAPAVLVLGLLTAVALVRSAPIATGIARLAALGTPVTVLMGLLGAFNHARFGSFLETGRRYMTSVPSPGGELGSQYVIPNAYSYLIRPPTFRWQFPFLKAEWGRAWEPTWLEMPLGYYAREPAAGLLITAPFFIMALFAVPPVVGALRRMAMPGAPRANPMDMPLLGIACLAVLAPVALFFFFAVTMRYAVDGVTGIALLSALGLGFALERFRTAPVARRILTSVAVILAACTVLFGVLLWTTSYYNYLWKFNPDLWHALGGGIIRSP